MDKFEVIHFGRKNRNANYNLNGKQSQNGSGQRDLGVCVHEFQKVSMQEQHVVKKKMGC